MAFSTPAQTPTMKAYWKINLRPKLFKLIRRVTQWAWKEPVVAILKERDFYKAECKRLENTAGTYANALQRIAFEGVNNPKNIARAALGRRIID